MGSLCMDNVIHGFTQICVWELDVMISMGFGYPRMLSMLSKNVTKYVHYPFTMDNCYPLMIYMGFGYPRMLSILSKDKKDKDKALFYIGLKNNKH